MELTTKRLAVEVKDASLGLVEAKFSTYDVIDSDGDVTVKGAFTDGQEVRISAWNHGSWQGALPVGKGVIHDEGDGAVMKGQFFLDTVAGSEHFAVVKALGDLQEWSYGFNVLDSEKGQKDGQSVRILKGLDVTEVAPVLKGAGIGTHTLVVKSAGSAALTLDLPPGFDAAVVGAAITKALQSHTDPNPDDSSDDDEAAEHKRRDTDLLRLVAATHGIPTGGTS